VHQSLFSLPLALSSGQKSRFRALFPDSRESLSAG
jgi:hypothetical protein